MHSSISLLATAGPVPFLFPWCTHSFPQPWISSSFHFTCALTYFPFSNCVPSSFPFPSILTPFRNPEYLVPFISLVHSPIPLLATASSFPFPHGALTPFPSRNPAHAVLLFYYYRINSFLQPWMPWSFHFTFALTGFPFSNCAPSSFPFPSALTPFRNPEYLVPFISLVH